MLYEMILCGVSLCPQINHGLINHQSFAVSIDASDLGTSPTLCCSLETTIDDRGTGI